MYSTEINNLRIQLVCKFLKQSSAFAYAISVRFGYRFQCKNNSIENMLDSYDQIVQKFRLGRVWKFLVKGTVV